MDMIPRSTTFCPAPATITEQNLEDQTGKVFIVTGATGGIGEGVANILYHRNGTVYLAARSESKVNDTILRIRKEHQNSTGKLVFLKLVLDDLTTIKSSAEEFLSKESRLDVLFNNAGVMIPPTGSKTKQGYELQYGVNNLAHFLLTHFLRPVLATTAKIAEPYSVRVIWVSSSAADGAPRPAIDFKNMDYAKEEGMWAKCSRSKAASVIHSAEFARREQRAGSGILSLALNPGNFVTNLQQNMPKIQLAMFKMIAHPPINGAYTELFAAFDKSITSANNGGWVSPFGKIEKPRADLVAEEIGRKLWTWSEEQTRPYL
ncbi:hypothetical protein CKM354_001236700 [Cercospora kikuchii]|uniref:Short-chain dehydrogenase n=1 Tax=Cercospora kikuchii TaxID=84275 RepID=A0A9P3FLX0_9PEZI|nr:uncharacterized protein CKM354_001236700 [Cercospora kikuchii]GIZ49335.1 hypothetical protein CKM354_001236700 [Cercospora kikuchii]